MSESAALLAAIRQAPDDDAPRLIYADWLDEHGQPERAEFIRVQIELARQNSPELRKREAELLAEHHDRFAGQLAAPGLRFGFDRGFVSRFGHTGLFVRDRLGPRSGSISCYRFSMGGTCYLCVGAAPHEYVELWRSHTELMADGTPYSIDGFDYPAKIRFPARNSITTLGVILGPVVELDVYDHEAQRQKSRKRPEHLHIDGFDSRQDSP